MTHMCTTYIVDDDAEVREALQLELAALGIEAPAFATGAAFIAASGSLPPGCVLLDISNPADGLGVLRHLVTCKKRFGAVMMSGSQDARKAALARELGASRWLEKPFAEEALVEAIEDACSRIPPAARSTRSESDCDQVAGVSDW